MENTPLNEATPTPLAAPALAPSESPSKLTPSQEKRLLAFMKMPTDKGIMRRPATQEIANKTLRNAAIAALVNALLIFVFGGASSIGGFIFAVLLCVTSYLFFKKNIAAYYLIIAYSIFILLIDILTGFRTGTSIIQVIFFYFYLNGVMTLSFTDLVKRSGRPFPIG